MATWFSQAATALKGYAASSTYQSSHVTSNQGAFVGSSDLGVGVFCFSGEGQVNGEPPAAPYIDKGGYAVNPVRTLGINPFTGEKGYGLFA